MGGKGWLGIGLLLAVLAAGVYIWKWMDAAVYPVADTLILAQNAAQTGEIEQAGKLLREAKQIWEKSWRAVATVADHAPMEEIDSLFSQVEQYFKQGLKEEFAALCGRLLVLVKAVSEAHSLNLWNFL